MEFKLLKLNKYSQFEIVILQETQKPSEKGFIAWIQTV